jgi:hypothetical protein
MHTTTADPTTTDDPPTVSLDAIAALPVPAREELARHLTDAVKTHGRKLAYHRHLCTQRRLLGQPEPPRPADVAPSVRELKALKTALYVLAGAYDDALPAMQACGMDLPERAATIRAGEV